MIWYFWGLLIVAEIILLIFPAWLSLNFRYLAWRVSQVLGIIIKWLFSGFRPTFLLVLGVASALFIRATIIKNFPENVTINSTSYSLIINNATHGIKDIITPGLSVKWIDILSPDFWMKVFVITVLLLLVYWAIRSRKRIILLQFINQTGDEKLKSSVEGISSGLQNELSRLVRLCTLVDDTNPFSPGTQTMRNKESNESALNSNISVSIGESLKSVVSSETKVKLGPLEIPIGATIGVLAKVMEGPQLTGSLLKDDSSLVLIANLNGGGHSEDWRISISDLEEKEDTTSAGLVAQMTQQLTYRIFTSLVQDELGSPSWKAVFHYVKGLSAYRDTLRTDRDKSLKLRQAEKEFLLALGEDKMFLQCYYNLGVVYSSLGQPESALSVLNKSIDPYQTETYLSNVYYALAENHYRMQEKRQGNADYKFSTKLCKRAIELQPIEAKNWDLLGRLKRYEKENELGRKLNTGEEIDYWREMIIPIREIATALAWKEMCCCSLKNKKIENLRDIAVNCARNLAVAYSQSNLVSGKHFFCQAIHLAPSDAELYYELGKTLNNSEDWIEAAKVLENAVKIKEHPTYWSELSLAYANLYEKDGKEDHEKKALDACRHVMDCSSGSENVELKPEKAMFKLLPGLLSLLSNTSPEAYYNNISIIYCRLSNWNWDFAKALLRLAGLLSVIDDGYAEAKELNNSTIRLKKALDALEDLLNQMNGTKKENCCKLNDPAKGKLKGAIEDIKDLNPRMTEISTRSQANNEDESVSYLDYAWYYLSLAEQSIDSDRSFRDINEYIKVALRDFRENLFPHALVINTLNQLEQGETECNEQYKRRLEELVKRLSIWDWGHDKVLFKLNVSKGILYEEAGKSPRLELVSELLENLENNKDRTKLEELRQRQLDGSWDWGHGQVLLALSDIETDLEKKEDLLETARMSLERDYLSDIANKGVQGQLALALVVQNKFGKALCHAQGSVILRPERSWDRSVLSYVYQGFNGFEESDSQLEIAVSIDPKEFFNYESMAWSKFKSINQLRDMDDRQKAFKRYVEILQRFLELIQNDFITTMNEAEENAEMRSWAHFWLGYAHYELNKYDLAISNWNEAKYLSEKSDGRSHLMAMLWLGTVYLDIKAHFECESIFKELIDFIEQKELKGVIRASKNAIWAYGELERELVGTEFGFVNKSLGYVMGYSCLSLSFSYAQRDANLSEASNLVKKAERYITNLEDTSQKNELEAMQADLQGWLIYKQVKQEEGSKNIKKSIEFLEKAVNKEANPEYYLHLALVLECRLDTEGEMLEKVESGKAELKCLLNRALACCDHVIDLDLQKKYTEQAKELRKRLEKSKKSQPKEK